ncbi:hypothetical protein D3C73_1527090 [compost metagenome]
MVSHEAPAGINRIIRRGSQRSFAVSRSQKRLIGTVGRASKRAFVPGKILDGRVLGDPHRNIIVFLGDPVIFMFLENIEINRLQIAP